ncbi:hypothetical protein OPV22_033608 [Ensete ventricosum]|uniref:Uncharacterized protein n=1 Tax=Ensete ventricosum TaxID=4639 RepID=A0AAV8PQF7_ENSVE|nr:hypothetical protein OPV22_033608 [Ensete ventricosum]
MVPAHKESMEETAKMERHLRILFIDLLVPHKEKSHQSEQSSAVSGSSRQIRTIGYPIFSESLRSCLNAFSMRYKKSRHNEYSSNGGRGFFLTIVLWQILVPKLGDKHASSAKHQSYIVSIRILLYHVPR